MGTVTVIGCVQVDLVVAPVSGLPPAGELRPRLFADWQYAQHQREGCPEQQVNDLVGLLAEDLSHEPRRRLADDRGKPQAWALVPVANVGEFRLDLNRARNPYCAYSSAYACPLPWRGNIIPVAVRFGQL